MTLPLGSGYVKAEDTSPAASVIAVRGNVLAQGKDGSSRNLKVKDVLFVSDTIQTGNAGRIQILFTDNSIVSLGRKSTLEIAQYAFEADQTGIMQTEVTEGVFRVMGGILTQTSPDKYQTRTPSGNIGIRGSMYTGHVAGNELALVFEGGKGVTLSNDTGTVLLSRPGNGTRSAGMKQPIATPRRFTSGDLKPFHQQLSLRSIGEAGKSGNTTGDSFLVPVHFSPQDSQQLQEVINKGGPAQESGTGPAEGGAAGLEAFRADLTDAVRKNPQDAARILRNAINNDNIPVQTALGSVLMGMQNPNRESFDAIMNEALEMGITLEGAKQIVNQLKQSGGVCK